MPHAAASGPPTQFGVNLRETQQGWQKLLHGDQVWPSCSGAFLPGALHYDGRNSGSGFLNEGKTVLGKESVSWLGCCSMTRTADSLPPVKELAEGDRKGSVSPCESCLARRAKIYIHQQSQKGQLASESHSSICGASWICMVDGAWGVFPSTCELHFSIPHGVSHLSALPAERFCHPPEITSTIKLDINMRAPQALVGAREGSGVSNAPIQGPRCPNLHWLCRPRRC